MHGWQRGGGWYVIIHADEVSREHRRGYSAKKPKARIETVVVGSGVEIREMVQWWVQGGKYKASFLLSDESEGETSAGLLISEVGGRFYAFYRSTYIFEMGDMVNWFPQALSLQIMIPTQKRDGGTPDCRASAGIKPDA